MSKKTRLQKPTRTLTRVSFPKFGPAKAFLENLPDTKEELEATILKKFISELEAKGRKFSTPISTGGWPDFETKEDGQRIGIEMVEIFNPDIGRKQGIQREYRKAIHEGIASIISEFHGLEITLSDNYQMPEYPSVKSSAGKRLVDLYV